MFSCIRCSCWRLFNHAVRKCLLQRAAKPGRSEADWHIFDATYESPSSAKNCEDEVFYSHFDIKSMHWDVPDRVCKNKCSCMSMLELWADWLCTLIGLLTRSTQSITVLLSHCITHAWFCIVMKGRFISMKCRWHTLLSAREFHPTHLCFVSLSGCTFYFNHV